MDNDQGDRPDGAPSEPTRKKCSAAPTLFVTDAELIRRTGVPEKVARAALHALDREKHRGLPTEAKIMGQPPILAGREAVVRSDQRHRIRKATRIDRGGEPWRWRRSVRKLEPAAQTLTSGLPR